MKVSKQSYRTMEVAVDSGKASGVGPTMITIRWNEGEETSAQASFDAGHAWIPVKEVHAAIQSFLDEFPLALEQEGPPSK